ncbi:MAG: hypothetical protein TE42_04740 [Candidatus Synechococcus spongiarum SP3]|uniref:Uncharacterized protein n=1 Tax=Candidatus Synechococcus spongiarum SP3 TaxID=1604020 RepID=A0A0G2HL38_9SYNE|nr:MAG: hypothetical protein TE42_04740 [Candidatus Synechococcus spongiarum SP3]
METVVSLGNSSMRWRTLWLPWIGLALTTVLLLKLLAVWVGSPQEGESGVLLGTLAFTVHDHGPMALVGLLLAAMALQANAGALSARAMATAQRLTWQLTAVLAILLAILFLGSTILGEVELQQAFAQQQAAMEQEAVQLRDELEQIQSAAFLDELAEPERLEELRSGLPDLPPDAGADEAVAALKQMVLSDLDDLQQVRENHSRAGMREVWGARLFRQLPEAVLAVGAAIIAGVALAGLAGAENKNPLAKDDRPTD